MPPSARNRAIRSARASTPSPTSTSRGGNRSLSSFPSKRSRYHSSKSSISSTPLLPECSLMRSASCSGVATFKPLDPGLVSERTTGHGEVLRYIEGWRAIELANAVLGHDRWGAELVGGVTCRELPEAAGGGTPPALYTATVRVTARGCPPHSDVGTAVAEDHSAEAHAVAVKAAVTDALKRALRHFGARFGNGLSAAEGGPALVPPAAEPDGFGAACWRSPPVPGPTRRARAPGSSSATGARSRSSTHRRSSPASTPSRADSTAATARGRPERRWPAPSAASWRRATDATTSPGSRCPSPRYRDSERP